MLRKSHKNKKYTEELKKKAVQAYLKEEGSQREICKKFGIWSIYFTKEQRCDIMKI